mgnify:FL=1
MKNPVEQQGSEAQHYGLGRHPNSLANIGKPRWKPGESGNPAGESLTSRLRRMMEKPLAPPLPTAPAAEVFVYSTLKLGIKGQPSLNKEVWDRHDGAVPQKIEIDKAAIDSRRVIVNILTGEDGLREAAFAFVRALEAGASGGGGEVEPGELGPGGAPGLPEQEAGSDGQEALEVIGEPPPPARQE